MPASDAAHPDVQQLTAFGLGRLAEPEATALEQHLAGCATCRDLLDTLPGDSFVNLVRAVRAPADATPATLPFPGAAALAGPQLPDELARHPKYRIVEL